MYSRFTYLQYKMNIERILRCDVCGLGFTTCGIKLSRKRHTRMHARRAYVIVSTHQVTGKLLVLFLCNDDVLHASISPRLLGWLRGLTPVLHPLVGIQTFSSPPTPPCDDDIGRHRTSNTHKNIPFAIKLNTQL